MFSWEETRSVQPACHSSTADRNDWTIQYKNRFYQILKENRARPKPKEKVVVRVLLDETMQIVYRDKKLNYEPLAQPPPKKAEKVTPVVELTPSAQWKPAPDHPWRKCRYGRRRTFLKSLDTMPETSSKEGALSSYLACCRKILNIPDEQFLDSSRDLTTGENEETHRRNVSKLKEAGRERLKTLSIVYGYQSLSTFYELNRTKVEVPNDEDIQSWVEEELDKTIEAMNNPEE